MLKHWKNIGTLAKTTSQQGKTLGQCELFAIFLQKTLTFQCLEKRDIA
jgi:hypothetical protein